MGDNTGRRAIVLRPIGFQRVGVWISPDKMWSQLRLTQIAPDFAERNYSVSGGVFVLLRLRIIKIIVLCEITTSDIVRNFISIKLSKTFTDFV
jgi:hypothetical protein